MKDSDEIDEFFEDELCDYPEIVKDIVEGNFNVNNLPPLDLLLKIIGELPSLYAFRGMENVKEMYRDSAGFLSQGAIPRRGDICLVRQLRVYDEKDFLKEIKGGKPVGIYWSLYENRCDYPIDEEMLDDVYVVISACFNVDCIDVVKTMLAHISWGAYNENEVRLFPGCKGVLDDFNVYDLNWEELKSFDLKGTKITT